MIFSKADFSKIEFGQEKCIQRYSISRIRNIEQRICRTA